MVVREIYSFLLHFSIKLIESSFARVLTRIQGSMQASSEQAASHMNAKISSKQLNSLAALPTSQPHFFTSVTRNARVQGTVGLAAKTASLNPTSLAMEFRAPEFSLLKECPVIKIESSGSPP